jgi:hypothetical protein
VPKGMRGTGRRAGSWAAAVLMVCSAACAQTPELRTSGAQTARAGSEWTLHFAEGGKAKYRLIPGVGEPGVAVFTDRSGHEVKILVAEDDTVLIVPSEGGCYRTGKLVDGHVTNGTSGGECKPGGSWTAEMR